MTQQACDVRPDPTLIPANMETVLKGTAAAFDTKRCFRKMSVFFKYAPFAFTVGKAAFFPHSTFMCFVRSENKQRLFPYTA